MPEAELAGVYEGLAHMGIDSRQADGMELFEIACAFGLHHPVAEEEPPEEEWDPIKARVEAQKAGLPPPSAPPPKARRQSPSATRPVNTVGPVNGGKAPSHSKSG